MMALVPWSMDIIEFLERHELNCVGKCIGLCLLYGLSYYTVWIVFYCMNKMNHLC